MEKIDVGLKSMKIRWTFRVDFFGFFFRKNYEFFLASLIGTKAADFGGKSKINGTGSFLSKCQKNGKNTRDNYEIFTFFWLKLQIFIIDLFLFPRKIYV